MNVLLCNNIAITVEDHVRIIEDHIGITEDHIRITEDHVRKVENQNITWSAGDLNLLLSVSECVAV